MQSPDCTPTAGSGTTAAPSATPSSATTPPGICGRCGPDRLAIPNPQARTILAEHHGEVVGLAHTILGRDATWGAYLDSLHVAYGLKRQGIGTRLLALSAQAVLDGSPSSGPYL